MNGLSVLPSPPLAEWVRDISTKNAADQSSGSFRSGLSRSPWLDLGGRTINFPQLPLKRNLAVLRTPAGPQGRRLRPVSLPQFMLGVRALAENGPVWPVFACSMWRLLPTPHLLGINFVMPPSSDARRASSSQSMFERGGSCPTSSPRCGARNAFLRRGPSRSQHASAPRAAAAASPAIGVSAAQIDGRSVAAAAPASPTLCLQSPGSHGFTN